MNLILVSLPGEELNEFGLQLEANYPVKVVAIEKNLCTDGTCIELFQEVKAMGLEINMLINNAGTGNTEFFKNGYYSDYDMQIRLNVLATTLVTHLFIEMLIKNGPSYILNVGSMASFFSLAKKQVYGATKSYINYFSKSLRRELKFDNVSVSVICPGGMFTNASASNTIKTGDYIARRSGMHPENVAPIAIDGLLKNKQVIVPGKINSTIVFLNRILPRFIVSFFEIRTMRRLHNPGAPVRKYNQQTIPVYSDINFK